MIARKYSTRFSRDEITPYIHTILIYTVAHAGLLINFNGIWWDDWTLYGTSASALHNEYKELGSFPPGLASLLHLFNEIGPSSYRLTTFFCYLFSTLILYKIIHRDYNSYNLALPIAILFAVIPVNGARIAAINIAYAICLVLFLLAAYVAREHIKIGLALLFASYMTASLLVFTLLILINEIVWFKKNPKNTGKTFIVRKIFLLASVPILFWLIKNVWFRPTGKYESYNQNFSLLNFPYQVKATALGIFSADVNIFMFLISLVFLAVVLKNFKFSEFVRLKVLFIGFVILFLGCLPYWVVGLIPSDEEWNSRHQLLMPFGLSLILVSLLPGVPRVSKALFLFLVSMSISWWVNTYIEFKSETSYVHSVISAISDSRPQIGACQELVVQEIRIKSNSDRPSKRFYEWNGMLTSAGFREKVTVIPNGDLEGFDSGKYDLYFNPIYKASSFTRSYNNVRCLLQITETPAKSSVRVQVFPLTQAQGK